MKKIKFRECRGNFEQSMKKMIWVSSFEEIINECNKNVPIGLPIIIYAEFGTESIFDARNGWVTFYILGKYNFPKNDILYPIGFSDGKF